MHFDSSHHSHVLNCVLLTQHGEGHFSSFSSSPTQGMDTDDKETTWKGQMNGLLDIQNNSYDVGEELFPVAPMVHHKA